MARGGLRGLALLRKLGGDPEGLTSAELHRRGINPAEAPPEVYAEVLAKLPIGRYGRPEDVATAVAYLASPAAGFCTGVNLVVDGGMLTRVQT